MNAATNKNANTLIGDQRGAIMVVGVFMCMFLIGTMWFVLGIGQSLVYHDHMQEAADAVTFSAAVVHARAMNMIVAINLIMMALVAVHLLLAFLHAVAMAALVACEVVCLASWECGFCACECLDPTSKWQEVQWNIMDKYDSAMAPILQGLSLTQTVISYGTIAAGVAESIYIGQTYYKDESGNPLTGVALSMSYPGNGKKGGLPILQEKAQILCHYLTDYLPLPGGLGDIVSDVIEGAFCSDNYFSKDEVILGWPLRTGQGFGGGDFWTDDKHGPKGNWDAKGTSGSKGKNGSDWMMIAGGVGGQDYPERSEHDVAIAGANFTSGGQQADTKPTAWPFFAAAEFYYDCNSTWDNNDCDNASSGPSDHAMYSIGWKARLIRAHVPKVGITGPIAGLVNPIGGRISYH